MPNDYFSNEEASTLNRDYNLFEMSEADRQTNEKTIETNDRTIAKNAGNEIDENDDTIESTLAETTDNRDEGISNDSSDSSSSTGSSDEDDCSDKDEKVDENAEFSSQEEDGQQRRIHEDLSTGENRSVARRKCSFVEFCRKNKFNVQPKLQFLWSIKPADRIVCDERVLRWCGFTGPYKHVKRSFRAALSRCFPDGLFESRSDSSENRRKNVVLSGHEFEFLLMNMSTDRARHTRRMFCNLKFLMQRYNAYERQWERSKKSKKLRAALPSMPKKCPMRCSFVKNNLDDVFADILVDESGPKRYCFSLYRVDEVAELRTNTVDKRRKVKVSRMTDDENTDVEEDSVAVARTCDEKDIARGWFVIRRRIGSYKTIEKKYTRKYPSAVRMFYCEYTDEEFNPYMLLKKQIAFRYDKCSFRYVGNVFYVYSNNDGELPSDDDVVIMINNVFDKLRSTDPHAVESIDSNKSTFAPVSEESNGVEQSSDQVSKNGVEKSTKRIDEEEKTGRQDSEEKNDEQKLGDEEADDGTEERIDEEGYACGGAIDGATDATRIKKPLVRGGKNIRQTVVDSTNDECDVSMDTDADDDEEEREDSDREQSENDEKREDDGNDAFNYTGLTGDETKDQRCDEETDLANCLIESNVEDGIENDGDVASQEDGDVVATIDGGTDDVHLDMTDFLISKKDLRTDNNVTSEDKERDEAISSLDEFCQAAMTVDEATSTTTSTTSTTTSTTPKKRRKDETTKKTNDRTENHRRKSEKSEKRKREAVDSSSETTSKRSSHNRSKKVRSSDALEKS